MWTLQDGEDKQLFSEKRRRCHWSTAWTWEVFKAKVEAMLPALDTNTDAYWWGDNIIQSDSDYQHMLVDARGEGEIQSFTFGRIGEEPE